MASLYQRARSPYWWIQWVDATGKRKLESTGCRINSVSDTRLARQKRAQKEVIEQSDRPSARKERDLSVWVHKWIASRYAKQPHTLESYTLTWVHLLRFLESKDICSADGIRREHSFEYLEWRQSPKGRAPGSKENVCRNTAIHDLVVLRLVLNEAVKRTWIVANPASKLGLKRDAPAEKPEFTEEQAKIVLAALPTLPDWMEISWKIAWHQGCRLAETSLPLKDVNLKRELITFTLKGGKRHTTRLNPALKPLFVKLIKEKKAVTWEFSRNASRDWSRVFKSLGMEGIGFHSTRVTVITKMARSGAVNEQQAMRFIGHASEQVHAIYQRLNTTDLDSCIDALTPSKGKRRKP